MLQLTVHTGSIKIILVSLKYVGNKREHKNEIDLHYIFSELIIAKIGKHFKGYIYQQRQTLLLP